MRKFILMVLVSMFFLVMPVGVAWGQVSADPPFFCIGGTPGQNSCPSDSPAKAPMPPSQPTPPPVRLNPALPPVENPLPGLQKALCNSFPRATGCPGAPPFKPEPRFPPIENPIETILKFERANRERFCHIVHNDSPLCQKGVGIEPYR